MGFLSNSPQGFANATKALNQLPQGLLAEMVMLIVCACIGRLIF